MATVEAVSWSRPSSHPARNILREALRLPANDRAALVAQLADNLDKPDPVMDALWLKEAERRLAIQRDNNPEAASRPRVQTPIRLRRAARGT